MYYIPLDYKKELDPLIQNYIDNIFQEFQSQILYWKLMDLEIGQFFIINSNTIFMTNNNQIELVTQAYPQIKIVNQYTIIKWQDDYETNKKQNSQIDSF